MKTKGVARIMVSQLTARLPSGMIALALLIHIEGIFHSYGSAGLVLAASSIGQAIAGPITSRLMGRVGARRVLIATTIVCAAALVVLALVPMPLWGCIGVGFLSGLSFPPVQPAVRTIYPKLVDAPYIPRLFSLDASAQELIWVGGPIVITLVSLQISSVVGVLLCATLLVGGGAWFIASPELGEVKFAPSTGRFGAVLLRGPVVLATAVGFLMVGAAAAIEASVVRRFGEGGLEAGIILGAMALASLTAGFMFGHREAGRYALSLWMCTMLGGAVMATMTGSSFWGTLAAIAFAGFGMAPALAIMFSLISARVQFSESAEAYGWANTGQLIGAAIGSAAAGFLIDGHGSNGGFLVAAAMALLGATVPLLFLQMQEAVGRRRRRRA